jgi:predicted secreted protein
MNLMTFILTITMIWIILLFISLPLGLKMPEEIQKGNCDGAPEKHYLFAKIFVTFFISILLSGIYFYYIA